MRARKLKSLVPTINLSRLPCDGVKKFPFFDKLIQYFKPFVNIPDQIIEQNSTTALVNLDNSSNLSNLLDLSGNTNFSGDTNGEDSVSELLDILIDVVTDDINLPAVLLLESEGSIVGRGEGDTGGESSEGDGGERFEGRGWR